MTRELIIEGQHVDLAPDTDITLEYTSNILGDIGKISLSHSYTIKLPKTLRNARALDDPDNTGRESRATRRYLSARYYRNGIDLIGPARAYILKTTQDAFEIALVWGNMVGLEELSQSSLSINDLHDLPILSWVDKQSGSIDYTGSNDVGGAHFARYDSGLGEMTWPYSLSAPHPCMGVAELLTHLLGHYSIPFTLSQGVKESLRDLVILAAPNHAPSALMNYESGVWTTRVILRQNSIFVSTNGTVSPIPPPLPGMPSTPGGPGMPAYGYNGWNSSGLMDTSLSLLTPVPDSYNPDKRYNIHVLLNLRIPAIEGAEPGYISIAAKNYGPNGKPQVVEILYTKYFEREGNDWVLFVDEDIDTEDYAGIGVEVSLKEGGPNFSEDLICSAFRDDYPLFAAYYVLDTIDIFHDDRFPITGNLPKIKQWDLIKACAGLLGWILRVHNGQLVISTYNEVLDVRGASDWSSKVDMVDAPADLSYNLSNWAQSNVVAYKGEEDVILGTRQKFSIDVADGTLSDSRTYYEAPFAASMLSTSLRHYKVTTDKEEWNETEDIDIQPRLLKIERRAGEQWLTFPKALQVDGLKAAHYAKVQEVIRKPIVISVNVRLNELDLARLDLTRTIYLGQFGHYYKILKVQTSATDLSKVELLQIA